MSPMDPSPGRAGSLRRLSESVTRVPRALWTRWSAMTPQTWVLLYFTIVFVEGTAALCYLRYLAFYTNAWDIGILQQSLWTASHDHRLFYYTAELFWNSSGSFLGVHWSPILFLFVPIYAAFPGPLTLMVLQSCALGGSAFPLFALARRRLDPTIALTLAALYLVSPPLLGGMLYDFHVEAFVPITALTTLYAWESRRPWLAGVAAALLLCTVEFAPLILGGIALTVAIRAVGTARRSVPAAPWPRALLAGWLPLAVVAASVPLTIAWFAIPKMISPGTPPITQIGPLGGSLLGILENLFTRPALVYQSVTDFGSHKVAYLAVLLIAAMFAWPLGAVDVLPAVPWLLVAVISTDVSYSRPVGDQYTFLVVPFLFVATASGLGHFLKWSGPRFRAWKAAARVSSQAPGRTHRPVLFSKRHNGRSGALVPRPIAVALVLVVLALPSQVWFSPASPLTHYSWLGTGKLPTSHDRALDSILDLIPAGASVSAEPDLFPQLANRIDAYPYYFQGTEFLVVDLHSYWFTAPLPPPDPPLTWYGSLQQNVTIPYGVYASEDGALLYKLGYNGTPVLFAPFHGVKAPPSFTPGTAFLEPGGGAPYGTYIEPVQRPSSATLWYGPYLLLPPGHYLIGTWVQATSTAAGSILLEITINDGRTILGTQTIRSSGLPSGWSEVATLVDVPYPAFIEVVGKGSGALPSVLFGGSVFTQLDCGGPLG